MASSASRLFWVAWIFTVVAMLVEHVIWFLVRSQDIGQALGYLSVPLLMGLVAGVLSGALAVAGRWLTRGKPAVIRYTIIAALAVLGAVLGTLFFPAMFLYKWFTIPVIGVVVGAGMPLFTRDRKEESNSNPDP